MPQTNEILLSVSAGSSMPMPRRTGGTHDVNGATQRAPKHKTLSRYYHDSWSFNLFLRFCHSIFLVSCNSQNMFRAILLSCSTASNVRYFRLLSLESSSFDRLFAVQPSYAAVWTPNAYFDLVFPWPLLYHPRPPFGSPKFYDLILWHILMANAL